MKKLIVFIIVLLPCFAYALEYSKVQPDIGAVTFVSKQMNVTVEGAFKKFTAQIKLDPVKPESGFARIEIDLASIDAGSAEANDEVKGKSWFNVAEFPKAVFVSSSVKSLGSGQFEAIGKMNLKGKSMEIKAPFTIKDEKNMLNIMGSFSLKRLDFGIGSGLWSDTSVVADEVQIKFIFVLKK